MVPSLPKFQKLLGNVFRQMVGLLGCPVQGQELDSLILEGPFQPRIFCDSMILPGTVHISHSAGWRENPLYPGYKSGF